MQGSLQGSLLPNPPCPKEGFEPLLNPRQSLARTKFATGRDRPTQSFLYDQQSLCPFGVGHCCFIGSACGSRSIFGSGDKLDGFIRKCE